MPAPQVTIRSYHGSSGVFLEQVAGFGEVELAWNESGPDTATVTLPFDSGHLHRDRLFPDGFGVFYEVDARDLGVPEVWTGRVKTPGGGRGERALALTGPASWLDRVSVPATPAPTYQRTGAVLRQLVDALPGLRLELGTLDEGGGGPVELRGEGFWSWLLGVTERRGEWPYLSALPGEVRYQLDLSASGYRRDLTGVEARVLSDGLNCRLECDLDLDPALEDMAVVAQSFLEGSSVRAARARAPAGVFLGRRAAMREPLASGIAQRLMAGFGGQVLVAPHVVTRAGLEEQLAHLLRRSRMLVTLATAYDVHPDAWGIAPQDLVSVRYPDDPHAIWDRAVGRVVACAYQVAPERALDITLELWAREED